MTFQHPISWFYNTVLGFVCSLTFFLHTSAAQIPVYDDEKNAKELNFNFHEIDNSDRVFITELKLDNEIIWALGYDGLFKFDGRKFHKMLDLSKERNLRAPDKMMIDKQGRIWLYNPSYSNSFHIYDIRSDKLKSIDELRDIKPYLTLIRNSLGVHNDQENNIWWKISDNEFLKLSSDLNLLKFDSTEPILSIMESGHTTFAHTPSGLKLVIDKRLESYIDITAQKIRITTGVNLDHIIYAEDPYNSKQCIFLSKENRILDTIEQPFSHRRLYSEEFVHHEMTNSTINTLENTILVHKRNSNHAYKLRIKSNSTGDPIYDRLGNVFIPSTNGIISIGEKKLEFEIINKESMISFRHINVFNDSILQFGSYSGFHEINLHTRDIVNRISDLTSYCHTEVDSNLAIITNHTGDLCYLKSSEGKKSQVSKLPISSPNKAENMTIKRVFFDKDKKVLWMAGVTEIWKKNMVNEELVQVSNDTINAATAMRRHKDGIMISTPNGLYKMLDNTDVKRIDLNTVVPGCALLHINDKNELFVHVKNDGIKILNDEYKIIAHYNYEIGVKNSTIYTLELDDKDNIWAGTRNGLLYIDREREVSKYYTYEDGIGQNDFNYESSHKSNDGTMYFGGIERLIKFHPDDIIMTDDYTKVKIKDAFLRDRNSTDFYSVYDTRNLSISHEKPELKLVFGSSNPLDFSYKDLIYQINDLPWQNLESGELLLKELPTGENLVRVKNKFHDELLITTKIISRFPLPGTLRVWLAFLLGVLGIIGLLGYMREKHLVKTNQYLEDQVQHRTKEINRKNSDLKHSNDTKDKIFSVLAHDLKSPINNLLNLTDTVNFLIKNDRIEDLLVTGKEIQKKTNDLKSLIDNLLHWSLQQQGKTYLVENRFKVRGPINNIVNYMEDLGMGKDLKLQVTIPEEHELMTDHSAFEIIMRNIIHNAIKYSYKGGTVKLTSVKKGNSLLLTTEDNGVGFSKEQIQAINTGNYLSTQGPYKEKGTGIGLTLVRHFVEKMGGEIILSSSDDTTRVKVTIPIGSCEEPVDSELAVVA